MRDVFLPAYLGIGQSLGGEALKVWLGWDAWRDLGREVPDRLVLPRNRQYNSKSALMTGVFGAYRTACWTERYEEASWMVTKDLYELTSRSDAHTDCQRMNRRSCAVVYTVSPLTAIVGH